MRLLKMWFWLPLGESLNCLLCYKYLWLLLVCNRWNFYKYSHICQAPTFNEFHVNNLSTISYSRITSLTRIGTWSKSTYQADIVVYKVFSCRLVMGLHCSFRAWRRRKRKRLNIYIYIYIYMCVCVCVCVCVKTHTFHDEKKMGCLILLCLSMQMWIHKDHLKHGETPKKKSERERKTLAKKKKVMKGWRPLRNTLMKKWGCLSLLLTLSY